MNIPSREELRALATTQSPNCVSIYLPTHRTGRDLRQDPIRLKNLLTQAEQELIARGVRSSDAKELLEPARLLFQDELFRRHLSDGLAIFVAPDTLHHFSVPLAFDELAVVNNRFYIKPLFPLMSGDGVYYILVISQNNVKLFEGTRWSIRPVELDKLPKSLSDALKYDDFEKSLQFHTRAGERGGERAAMFYGHGDLKDLRKDELLRYFREIDHGLHEFLHDKDNPLILAGVEYYLPIYREANTYRHLMDRMIPGNHDTDNPMTLHDEAWSIVEPVFTEPYRRAIEQLHQLLGTEKADVKLGKILPYAFQGRIDTLFVDHKKRRWGKFDPQTGHLTTGEKKENECEDLYDLAAVQTFLTGGNVYVVTDEGDLKGNDIAAIFRF